ncbi:MAG: tetratricopeptide repeat protein [Nostoc sp.]|uniref:tetratricopeptide repeat protein n=1 Tax=Nostoc sp. TaxID=1180 RepID=UPI002FFAD990
MNIQNEDLNLYNDYESRIQQYKRELEKAIEQNPNSINRKIYYQLKNVQQALGLTDEAVAVAYTSLVSDLQQQGYMEAEVISILEEAIRINRKVAAAYTTLETILYKQGNKKEAIKNLETARSLFMEQGMVAEANKIKQSIEYLHKSNNLWLHITRFLIGSSETSEPIHGNASQEEINRRLWRVEKRPTFHAEHFHHKGDIMSDKSETSSYTFNNAKFGGGFAGTQGTQTGGTLNDYSSSPNLSQAAAEIQKLLKQLSAANPTTTSTEKMRVVTKAVDKIENDPAFKELVIAVLQSGSTEAFQQKINHPLAKKLLSSIEEWRHVE